MLRFAELLPLIQLCNAVYVIQDAYTPSNFFDMFDFFTGPDPTQGFVKFVDQTTALSAGMISQDNTSVRFGVDFKTMNPEGGRSSIRLESKNTYNQGLIILDLAHMPGGICGTWPAFWTIGPEWPSNGEIDILEGVNSQVADAMTLHTGPGCSINSSGNERFTGSVKTSNCDVQAPGQGANVGCGIVTNDTTTYGDGFNDIGGGVYATEWTADTISIYHFARANVPADISSGAPTPSSWGEPLAVFSGCNFQEAVKNQTIIFDTTFCGQWAGQDSVWRADPVCSQKAATCQEFVSNNPTDFANAYWEVNSLKIYRQQDTGYIGQSPIPTPQPSPAESSSSDIATLAPTESTGIPLIVSTMNTFSTMVQKHCSCHY
ncbi:uncharacterized protein PV09_01424 [Verruconis gallopava]|uniref:endo-1,3(4)-beta-glucanase n=1 Tax=Verruconis gallopava TaxID=253628 RepID=A0A0D1Z3D5_9PEZI|nr:uncharacterized protein PV09_01424 [Verruconis gallopava]KIW07452.1 hypothetical protein PV09_01424 [Verruconis gallopava]